MCENAQMDWDDLRYVLAIARHQTLSAAGDALSVTHTTVGRRLKSLEEELGVRLFHRTPDGFMPTPAGQDIVEVARETEVEVLSLEGRLLGRDAKLSGELRVATMDIFLGGFPHVFGSFCERYPDVNLTVVASNEEASLTRREADVALRMTDTPPPYLVGRKLGRIRFGAYASRELVESRGEDAPWADYPWIWWDERMNLGFLDEWLQKRAPGAEILMRVNVDSVLLRRMLESGVGASLISVFEGDAHPDLVRLGPPIEEFARTLWLLTLPELRHTSRVRAFMDHVEEALRPVLPS